MNSGHDMSSLFWYDNPEYGPVAQWLEAADLNPVQCGFDSH